MMNSRVYLLALLSCLGVNSAFSALDPADVASVAASKIKIIEYWSGVLKHLKASGYSSNSPEVRHAQSELYSAKKIQEKNPLDMTGI